MSVQADLHEMSTQTRMHACTQKVYIYICIRTFTHTYIHTHACMHTYIHTCICTAASAQRTRRAGASESKIS